MKRSSGYYIIKDDAHYAFNFRNDGPNAKSVKLKYTTFGAWTELTKGQLAAGLVDDGNGVTIAIEKQPDIRLDYMRLHELILLLRTYTKETEWPTGTRIYKKKQKRKKKPK